jgi:hypothetical protein
MFECKVRNEKNTDIELSHNVTTKEGVAEIVQVYAAHIQSLPLNQTMHVHVSAGVDIPFEQMFQVYVGVRKVHTTFKCVDEVNVYLVDSLTVRCFRCLLNLINPTVRIVIHTVPE